MTSWLKRSISLLALVAITFSVGYIVGHQPQENPPTVVAQQPDPNDELFLPYFEAWELLHTYYVDPLDNDQLLEDSIQGLMTSVGDPNMDYIPADRYQQVLESLNASFEGIGATVRKDEVTGGLEIVRPLPNSPALAAGLLSGDIVITVDGEDITALEQDVIISKVRGPADTQVVLGVQRGDNEALIEFTITRARISLPTTAFEILDGNIGYIQLFSFSRESANEVTNALREMDAENLNGLILDLRGNSGGYLDISLRILSEFISDGVILIEKTGEGDEFHYADGAVSAPNVPMVVLVDEGSASASEIVAGAFQDRERATVIGTTTFGKGTVQTWRSLSNGGGIRITIARWYTPDERTIDLEGITPDIEVEFPPLDPDETYSQENDPQLQAALEFLLEDIAERVNE